MRIFGLHRNCSITLRAAALPVLVFYALAAGHGFIPELCPTQSHAPQACEDGESPAYCPIAATGASDSDDQPTLRSDLDAANCGFRYAVMALIQPVYLAFLQWHIDNDETNGE